MTALGVDRDAPDDAPAPLSRVLADELVAHRAGDRGAADRLARRATPVLWHVARGRGADPTTAEDAVQNALLALVRHAGEIQEPAAVLKWLVVTVGREVSRLNRAAARTEPRAAVDLETQAGPDAEPEAVTLVRERDVLLWRAVRRLPARCQQLLRVIAFADRPDYSSISQALGMPVGSIGPTRRRCLGKLQALLAAEPRWSGA